MLAIKTILHPTDFSAPSELAFRLACSLARDYGARLVVAHVAEPVGVAFAEGMAMPPPPIDRGALNARLRDMNCRQPAIAIEHTLVEGDAANGILRLAQEASCDVIVMGTHGRTGLGRMLMGSVAEQVVRKATCPVLTVKLPLPEKAAKETPHRREEVVCR